MRIPSSKNVLAAATVLVATSLSVTSGWAGGIWVSTSEPAHGNEWNRGTLTRVFTYNDGSEDGVVLKFANNDKGELLSLSLSTNLWSVDLLRWLPHRAQPFPARAMIGVDAWKSKKISALVLDLPYHLTNSSDEDTPGQCSELLVSIRDGKVYESRNAETPSLRCQQ